MNNDIIKHFIQFQQWDYSQTITFTYFNTLNNEYVSSFCFDITQKTIWLCAVYVNDKYRGSKMFNSMMNDMFEYNKIYLRRNLILKVRRNNFIYDKYINLGFQFHKINYDPMFDELIYYYESEDE